MWGAVMKLLGGGPSHDSTQEHPAALSLQAELQRAAEWTEALLDRSQDLLCEHNLEGRLLFANGVMARLLGYTPEEILQVPIRDFVNPKYRTEFDTYLREIARKRQAEGVLPVITRAGERRYWEFHSTLRSEPVERPVVHSIGHDVTERVLAARALRLTNKKLVEIMRKQEAMLRELQLFRALLDQSNDAIEVIEPGTMRLLDVNERAYKELGYSREELLSMTIFDINPTVTPELVTSRMQELKKSKFLMLEGLHRRKDGTTFPVEVSVRCVQLDREYIVAVSRDITQRKRAEALVALQKRVLEMIASGHPLEESLTTLVRLIEEQCDGMLCSVLLLDEDRMHVRHGAAPSLPGAYIEAVDGATIGPQAGSCGTAMYRKEAVVVTDIERDPLWEGYPDLVNLMKAAGLRACWSTPILSGEKEVLGSFAMYHREPQGPTVAETRLVEVATYLASVAIERKRAAALLEGSERRLRAVLERAPVGIALVDSRTGRFLQVNQKLCKIVGRNEEEMLQLRFQDITHPDDLTASENYLKQTAEDRTRSLDIEKRYVRSDGSAVRVTLSVVPMWQPGEEARWNMAIVQDITERKRAEDALRSSEESLRLAQEVAQIGTFDRNLVTGEGRWTPQLESMHGLAPGGYPRTISQFIQLVHPADQQQLSELIARSMESGEGHGEWRVVWPDGTVHWIAGRWSVFRDADGKPTRVIGIDYDITERKQAEEALRASERRQHKIAKELEAERARLIEAQAVAKVGSWEVELPSLEVTWSEQTHRIFETDPSHFHPRRSNFVEFIHPEDRAKVDAAFHASLDKGAAPSNVEYRIVMVDGRVKVLEEQWKVFHDEHGRPIRLMGTCRDITDRKQAEEALRESEELMRLAQEVAQVGMFERNLVTGKSRWTPEMEAIYALPSGKFPQSLEGFLELLHPDDREKVSRLVAQSKETGEAQGEWRIVCRDGSVRWIAGRWRVFKDARGRPTRVIGMDQDITERKHIEEELRLAKERLTEEKHLLEHEIDTEFGFEEIVGQSKVLKAVMKDASRVAPTDAAVLLLGETGTGKELMARAIHRLSPRASQNFIKMNCAAIPTGLLESELFGAEKGAFTGAVSRKIGRMELADNGTLFLDEIGEIPLALQPKLLRVLQDQEFERLGGTQTLKVNFRLIAATNRDLAEDVKDNRFRSDLFYRLNVFPIRVPPLRERRDDIPQLVEHFVQKFARKMNKPIKSISKRTMDALVAWDWPGNVRELENFLERSVILTNGSVLEAPLSELQARLSSTGDRGGTLEAAERRHVLEALRQSKGRIGGDQGAAAKLGLKRTTLQSKLKQLGINPRLPPDA